jgi:hypothetical protein
MATAVANKPPSTVVYLLSPMAGVLSYLVPGLGQIVQGRVGKGILFLVCIYTLFFYGIYLGTGSVTIRGRTYRLNSNVYLPDTAEDDVQGTFNRVTTNLYNRPQFAGQFWVGVAAWPAIWQYMHFDRATSHEIEHLYAKADDSEKSHDPESAAELREKAEELEHSERGRHPLLGDFEREPSASVINAVHNAGHKGLELGWVYTVIAGVLNIMVIYDAVAGPAFRSSRESENDKEKKAE